MITRDQVVSIGRLLKPHGICGELRFVFNDDVFDRVEEPCLLLDIDGILVPFFPESYRFCGESSALVKLEDIDDEKQAMTLADKEVFFPKDRYPDEAPAEETAASWRDLEGYLLVDAASGRRVGRVERVDDSTSNVFAEVAVGEDSLLLPLAEPLIDEINPVEHLLRLRISEGLLDLDRLETL